MSARRTGWKNTARARWVPAEKHSADGTAFDRQQNTTSRPRCKGCGQPIRHPDRNWFCDYPCVQLWLQRQTDEANGSGGAAQEMSPIGDIPEADSVEQDAHDERRVDDAQAEQS